MKISPFFLQGYAVIPELLCFYFQYLYLPVSEHPRHSPDRSQASSGVVRRMARSVWHPAHDTWYKIKESSQQFSLAVASECVFCPSWPCAPALSSAPPAGLSMEEVREYERTMQEKTNCKVKSSQNAGEAANINNLKKKPTRVNYTCNPEKSYYYLCPHHPHFKMRRPSTCM